MSTLAQRLQAEIDRANETTSKTDTNVHNAIGSLIEGYGQGSIEQVAWHQCPEAVRNYLENVTYDPNDYTTSQIADYAPATAVSSNTKPVGKTVDGVTYYNEVPNVDTPFSSTNKAGTVMPLDRLRWINSATDNVRDLGGWECDGGTVKYGILFRGGECKEADRDLMVNEVGIRVELNLRGDESYTGNDRNYSLWGIKFLKPSTYAWYSLTNTTLWYELLSHVFEHASYGIPMFFHCSAGADRTGTLACVLEALLGVSQSDIDKDYELTCFYSGTDTDQHARRRNEADWQGLINQIVAMDGTSFSDKVIQWVGRLGFTAKQINQFRHTMVDGNPADVVVESDTVTVTTNLTNCTFEGLSTAVKGEPYSATITPNDGATLQSVTYTMGGVEYTSSSEFYIADVTGDIVITAVAEAEMVNLVDTLGVAEGYRISMSSGNNSATTGYCAIGSDASKVIPVASGDIIRVKGNVDIPSTSDGKSAICGYSADGTHTGASQGSYLYVGTNTAISCTYDNSIYTITINPSANYTSIRICFPCTDTTGLIITKNQVIS